MESRLYGDTGWLSLLAAGGGALAVTSDSTALRVSLAPAEEVDTITSPDNAQLVLLGRLRVDENGNGHLRFIVPHVPSGDYLTLTHCVRCAPYSAGRELLPTGPFPGHFIVLGREGSGGFPVTGRRCRRLPYRRAWCWVDSEEKAAA